MYKYRIPTPPSKSPSRSFTLVELIIVIIIVGVLAAVGISQYSLTVEKSRITEAKIRIGVMRQLAVQYYLEKGDIAGVTNADLGVGGGCTSDSFYSYSIGYQCCGYVILHASRCSSGGKTPNSTNPYTISYRCYPVWSAATSKWMCDYEGEHSGCFGMPPYT